MAEIEVVQVSAETEPAEAAEVKGDGPINGAAVAAEVGARLWPAPDDPYPCAKRVMQEAINEGRPIYYWCDQWYRWVGTHYQQQTLEMLRDYLGPKLAHARYLGAKGELSWKPTPPKLNGVIDMARGLARLADDAIEAPGWVDGRYEPMIACRNGLVRVGDRVRVAHTPDYFNLMALPFDYEPNAPKPKRWLKFLDEAFDGDAESIRLLQLWFGYVISGRMDLEQLLVVIGPSGSGKGTITTVLQALLGQQNCAAVLGDHFSRDFAFQPRLGKSLAVLADARVTFGKRLVEAILVLTGRDLVPVNIKNKPLISVHLPTRLMFLSNEIPNLPDDSGAIARRVVMLYMPKSYSGDDGNPEGDNRLKDYLVSEELPGILLWALDGVSGLDGLTRLPQPERARRHLDAMRESSSPVTNFLQETCEFGTDDIDGADSDRYWVLKDVLYEKWKRWCDANGHEAGSKENLSRKLIAAMPRIAPAVDFNHQAKRGPSGKQVPAYAGLRLQPDAAGVRPKW